jgi:hypothetical protein
MSAAFVQRTMLIIPEAQRTEPAASGLAQVAINYITSRCAKGLCEELQKLPAENANSERVIGSERHPQIRAFSTRNMSRSSARADQFQDGVRCIY